MRRQFIAGLAVSILSGVAISLSQATESGISLYIPGLRGPFAGVVPPPGFYFNNDAYYYYGEFGGGRRTEIGGAVLANVKQRAYLDFLTPIWVTPLQLFGATWRSRRRCLSAPHSSARGRSSRPRG